MEHLRAKLFCRSIVQQLKVHETPTVVDLERIDCTTREVDRDILSADQKYISHIRFSVKT